MNYAYGVEYFKREGYESYSMIIGDGYGKKRRPISKPQKISNGVAQEVEIEIGDVMVAVRNRWVMLCEKAEILLYGVDDIVNGEPVLVLFDSFDGKYWDNKKHIHYKHLIDLALQKVGRVGMFNKMDLASLQKLIATGNNLK